MLNFIEVTALAAELPAKVVGDPVLFDIVFAEGSVLNYRDTLGANADFQRIFNSSLRSNGILKAPMKFYASLAHNNADLEATEYAIERAIEACAHYY